MENRLVSECYKARVPASVMLFGEHAVLHGSPAIVAAINKYLTVTLTQRHDQLINIHSRQYGAFSTTTNNFVVQPPFEFVLTAIMQKLPECKSGFELTIDAEFSGVVGFGSSAAVTIATLAVLHQWLNNQPLELRSLFLQAKTVIQKVQGMGSGADVAASVYGGVVLYRINPMTIEKIADALPIILVYSGKKMPTSAVVSLVESKREKYPELFGKLYQAIESCSNGAVAAIRSQNWAEVGELMNVHQGLQDALGVNNEILAELIFRLRNYPEVYGAKISGSGLGDCVVALGAVPDGTFPQNQQQFQLGVKQLSGSVSVPGVEILS